jgi:hypothetical protein
MRASVATGHQPTNCSVRAANAYPCGATFSALAADPVVITIESVRVGLENLESAMGNVATVEIGWRRRDAQGRV